MNWLIHPIKAVSEWSVKKFVVGIANSALDKYARNVSVARAYVAKYGTKVENVLAFLKSLDAKLADGKIDDAETDAIIKEATELGKELAA